MCGIAGHLRLDGAPADRALVGTMTAALAHRGPDGVGRFADREIALGIRRLAMVDLATGDQPRYSEGRRVCAIVNGEIYNHRELGAALRARGHTLLGCSDTEVVAHLFEERGPAALDALSGMFALAVWDGRERRLVLARDPLGIKPLYYAVQGPDLLFASELKALLRYRHLDRRIDPRAIHGYLAQLAVPEPRTVLRSVRKLPAGHLLVASRGRVHLRRYWDVPVPPPDGQRAGWTGAAERAACRALRAALVDTVRASLRGDAPLGVFLSGGLDSSTLAALAAADVPSLPTFSVRFAEPGFDESPFARLVARTFATRHHELDVTAADAAHAVDTGLADVIDEPFADASLIPTYLLSRHARAVVKGVLAGEGMDELFAGSSWHDHRPRAFGRMAADPRRRVFSPGELRRLYAPAFRRALRASPPQPLLGHRAPGATTGPLSRALYFDLKNYLPSDMLWKMDRASMAHGLEVRVPFLSRDFVEHVARIPAGLKRRGGVTKYLLRQAVRGLLPGAVIERRKQGFAVPLDVWLWKDGPFRDLVYDHLVSPQSRARALLDFTAVDRLRREHESLTRLHGYRLWSLFVLELWHRRHLDRPT